MKVQPPDSWPKTLRGCEWGNIMSPHAFCDYYAAEWASRQLRPFPHHDTFPKRLLRMRLSARYLKAVQGLARRCSRRFGLFSFNDTDLIL